MQWSIGVMKREPRFHYSITPYSMTPVGARSCRAGLPAFHEPGDPDAAFIEHNHRQTHSDQRENVRGGSNNGSENENEHDGVGPGAGHEFVSDQSEAHEHQHYDGQFKGQAKTESEARYKRIILLHCPGWSPTERLRVVKKEEDRFGQQPKIANKDAGKKKRKADADGREQDFLLHRRQRRKDKFGGKKQKQRKREDDTGIKSEVKGNHH